MPPSWRRVCLLALAMIIVIMGVAGSGKTLIGRKLAEQLGWRFIDADDHHPPANIERMRRGTPLTDADRLPWLDALNGVLAGVVERGEDAVLACSALKQSYRERLTRGIGDVLLVYLRTMPSVIEQRLLHRTGHFFSAAMMQSQFDTLEEPADALVLDAAAPPAELVREIMRALSSS